MKIQVGDILRIDNNDQIPVSFIRSNFDLYYSVAHYKIIRLAS